MTANMLRALLSNCSYCIYWWGHETYTFWQVKIDYLSWSFI